MGAALLSQHLVTGPSDRLHVGEHVALANALINTHGGHVWLGAEAILGHDVMLLTGTHDFRLHGAARRKTWERDDRTIRIGKGAWLASRVTVIGPCSIGDNAVIASGCVVDFDVPADAIVRPESRYVVEAIR